MKWKQRGHEFDQMYANICNKEAFWLFGAGDYGSQFIKSFPEKIKVLGYIDNDEKKWGEIINQYPCYALSGDLVKKEHGIIITMSQIARVGVIEQLIELGYQKNVDFFLIEEWVSVYYVYRYNRVYFTSISFLPSTICNLKCRHCLNFNPFAKKFFVREWDALIKDVDLFFQCVDYIMLFHVSGGEPMLYKHTADLIEYIALRYGNRIGTLRTVTNGTVVPSNEILEKLSKHDIEITVDDYREAVPQYNDNFDNLISKLEEYNIRYYINKVDSWIDLAPENTDYSNYSEEQLIQHRDGCSQSWQELRDGKLYSCNYAAYATVAGIAGELDLEETYNLSDFTPENKKELIEFRLGFTNKGYTNFCKFCRGFTVENDKVVDPAIQVDK